MTIEIANRLIKLRKAKGLSQEELADKLGLSRQAVSKWERAEASPDTDNLICLAKIYGISLDDLLKTDDDVDTIIKEQIKDNKENEEKPLRDSTIITNKGIHVVKKNGKIIDVDDDGIRITDNGIRSYKDCKIGRGIRICNFLEGALYVIATAIYVILGCTLNVWSNWWIIFFIPEVICSIPRAIVKRKFCQFDISLLCCFIYFFICMVYPGMEANLWHPTWVVFLAIPVYYVVFAKIDNLINNEFIVDIDEREDDDDDDEDDKD